MTMITPSYLGETIEYSSLHACRSTLEDPTAQARCNGQPRRITIGKYGDWTLDKARKEAARVLASLRSGVDPTTGDPDRITLGEAWVDYKKDLIKAGKSPKTLRRYEHLATHYLKGWFNRPLASISRRDVRDRHSELAEQIEKGYYDGRRTNRGRKLEPYNRVGKTQANDVFRFFRSLYNNAVGVNEKLPANPCIALTWFAGHEGKHEAIPAEELPRWRREVEQLSSVRRDYSLFLVETGLRVKSASEARWKDVDFERKLLHVPLPKGGKDRAFDLPLSSQLVELLAARRTENEKLWPASPWVFPAESASKHLTSPPRITIDGVRYKPHRLRATFITVAEGLNESAYSIKLLVNHALPQNDVTAAYMAIGVERLRGPMQRISDQLETYLRGPATVIPMQRTAAA